MTAASVLILVSKFLETHHMRWALEMKELGQRCPRPPGCPAKSPFDFHVCCGHSSLYTSGTIQVYNLDGALVVKETCCIAQIKGRYMGIKVIAGSLSPSQRDPGTMSLGGSVG